MGKVIAKVLGKLKQVCVARISDRAERQQKFTKNFEILKKLI